MRTRLLYPLLVLFPNVLSAAYMCTRIMYPVTLGCSPANAPGDTGECVYPHNVRGNTCVAGRS